MPIKHQQDSYRTRGGVRHECWDDLCDESLGPLQTQAKTLVRDLLASGRRAFYETHDSYVRVFAGPAGSASKTERSRAASRWAKSQTRYRFIGDGDGEWEIRAGSQRIGGVPFDTLVEAHYWAHEHATGISPGSPNHQPDGTDSPGERAPTMAPNPNDPDDAWWEEERQSEAASAGRRGPTPYTPPRYDEVFVAGTAALDEAE
jgi:hypothetical protein